jgi:hypothetical protein
MPRYPMPRYPVPRYPMPLVQESRESQRESLLRRLNEAVQRDDEKAIKRENENDLD